MNICFLISPSSKYFGFITLENQSFKVSTVNFNSAGNNSARDVDFFDVRSSGFKPERSNF